MELEGKGRKQQFPNHVVKKASRSKSTMTYFPALSYHLLKDNSPNFFPHSPLLHPVEKSPDFAHYFIFISLWALFETRPHKSPKAKMPANTRQPIKRKQVLCGLLLTVRYKSWMLLTGIISTAWANISSRVRSSFSQRVSRRMFGSSWTLRRQEIRSPPPRNNMRN